MGFDNNYEVQNHNILNNPFIFYFLVWNFKGEKNKMAAAFRIFANLEKSGYVCKNKYKG